MLIVLTTTFIYLIQAAQNFDDALANTVFDKGKNAIILFYESKES